MIDMLAQKSAEVDALLRDNENLRAFIQEHVKQPVTRENAIWPRASIVKHPENCQNNKYSLFVF